MTEPGSLAGAEAVAVSAGHLYVVDGNEPAGTFRLDEFQAPSGSFEAQLVHSKGNEGEPAPRLGLAVGQVGSEVVLYSGAAGPSIEEKREDVVDAIGSSGVLLAVWKGVATPAKAFGEGPSGLPGVPDVAVDESKSLADWASGDLFVANNNRRATPEAHAVDVFKPAAGGKEPTTLVTQLTEAEPGVPFTGPTAVAVDDSNGDVFVVDGESVPGNGSVVDVFEPVPSMVGVYKFVFHITASPAHSFEHISGIALDGSEGDIYVSEGNEVDQFRLAASNVSAEFVGALRGPPGEAFNRVTSIASDPEGTHDLFVADRREGASVVDQFGPDLVIPDVSTHAASRVTATSAALSGTVNPDNEGPATCQFAWGTSPELGQTVACAPETSEGNSPVEVHGALTGLQPDTTYFYRLQASNTNGTNSGEGSGAECNGVVGPVACFTTLGPGLHDEAVAAVTATTAKLSATINPDKLPTSVYFEYGLTTSYGANIPAAPGEPIGAGEGDIQFGPRLLTGLTPGTPYHYRVVVVSEASPGAFETFRGEDQTFITQTGGQFTLPDSRQWELVSSATARGSLPEPIKAEAVIQAAVEGNAIAYPMTIPTEESPQGGSAVLTPVVSTRESNGWATQDLNLPHEHEVGVPLGNLDEYFFFSEDLASAVVQPFGSFIPSTSPQALAPQEASEQTAFLRTVFAPGNPGAPCLPSSMHCYRPLVTGKAGFSDVPPNTAFGEEGKCPLDETGKRRKGICGPQAVGASPDASYVVLRSRVALTATPTSGEALYEWRAGLPAAQRLTLVSRLPGAGGEPAAGPALGSSNAGAQDVNTRHAVSADGSRIVFAAGTEGSAHLYLRDVAGEQTLQLDTGLGGSPEFQTADKNVNELFFTDAGDLYRYDVVHHERVAITEGAAVQGSVIGASEDGTYVYFVANGVLKNSGTPVPGAVSGHCGGPSPNGALCNLYVARAGKLALVGVLSGEDTPDWAGGTGGSLNSLTARVSPSGEWLAFMSNRELTGYNNHDAATGLPDEEVFLFNVQTKHIACASCAPTGVRPVGVKYEALSLGLVGGDGIWEPGVSLAANVPGWTPYEVGHAAHQSRYLSDSGRLFFNSSTPLVPLDQNGPQEDVYEFEPIGTGGCTSSTSTGSIVFVASAGGCVALISPGSSGEESGFVDASESGGDVFFLSSAPLAQARDNSLHLYDAHECTGMSPCPSPHAEPPPPCPTADACRPAPTPQPEVFGAPSSSTFSGPGNFAPPPPAAKAKPLTRAQKLKQALNVCRRRKRAARHRCERQARARYAAHKATRPAAKKRGGSR